MSDQNQINIEVAQLKSQIQALIAENQALVESVNNLLQNSVQIRAGNILHANENAQLKAQIADLQSQLSVANKVVEKSTNLIPGEAVQVQTDGA